MRKVLIIGLIMVLAFALIIGCSSKKQTTPKPTQTQVKQPETPASPEAGTPAGKTEEGTKPEEGKAAPPPAGKEGETPAPPQGGEGGHATKMLPKDEIGYLVDVKPMYCTKKGAKDEDFKTAEDSKFPPETKGVVLSIGKSEKYPKGKEFTVNLIATPSGEVLVTQTVKSDDLIKKEGRVKLYKEGMEYQPGMYIVQIIEGGTKKEKVLTFEIGAKEGSVPPPPTSPEGKKEEGKAAPPPAGGEKPKADTPKTEGK